MKESQRQRSVRDALNAKQIALAPHLVDAIAYALDECGVHWRCHETRDAVERMFSRSRAAGTMRLRVTAWRYLRERGETLQAIGDVFGRHHSSVCSALRGRDA